MSFWKNNNFFVGLTVALILTVISILLILLLVPFVFNLAGWENPSTKIFLLSIAPSIIMMRYYMKVLHFDKSGAGALVIVFLGIIIYFAFFAGKLSQFPMVN